MAWTYILKTFKPPYERLPLKVRRGDICGFVCMLQQKYQRMEPEEVRLEVCWFYGTFLLRSEAVEDFFPRIEERRRKLKLWGRKVLDEDFRVLSCWSLVPRHVESR